MAQAMNKYLVIMLLKTVVSLSYHSVLSFKLYCIRCYVFLSYHAMHNSGIQLFHGTVKYCSSHMYLNVRKPVFTVHMHVA